MSAVDALHRHGAEAATVLLGVDGVLDGERRRARFVASNHAVPAMTVAVGEWGRIEAALAEVDGAAPLVTVERVELSPNLASSESQSVSTAPPRRRVTYVTSEIAASGAHPRYLELIHRLREEGAAGATALRGVWGFRGATCAARRPGAGAAARRADPGRSDRRARAPPPAGASSPSPSSATTTSSTPSRLRKLLLWSDSRRVLRG